MLGSPRSGRSGGRPKSPRGDKTKTAKDVSDQSDSPRGRTRSPSPNRKSPKKGGGGGRASRAGSTAKGRATENNEQDISLATGASYVWVPDSQEVWKLATLDGAAGTSGDAQDIVTVNTAREQRVEIAREKTRIWDPSHSLYLEDAAKLNNLHEPALLNLLKTRFSEDDIYTYTGNVLISINPYKQIPFMYDMPMMDAPIRQALSKRISSGGALGSGGIAGAGDVDDAPDDSDDEDALSGPKRWREREKEYEYNVLNHPHVYSVADKAHRYMTEQADGGGQLAVRTRPINQSIIITGESGAGKTEAAKHVMRYLIAASQVLSGKECGSLGELIESTLVQSTVILEAFGNAKTVRNDNSSRFGKYIKLQYDKSWQLTGARTLHFLLEKSRLVHQDAQERNYHIFYQLCKGASKEMREALFLSANPADYQMLRHGGVFTQSEGVDDAEEFGRCKAALQTLGLSQDNISSVWKTLAAVLHMGNVEFVDKEAGSGPITAGDEEGAAPQDTKKASKIDLVLPGMQIKDVADLLGVPAGLFVNAIRTRTTLSGRGSSFEIPLDRHQAMNNLHGLVKHLYGQLFAWLVGQVNASHSKLPTSSSTSGEGEETKYAAFTGILDIFGFEIMTRNSFEQLCINFANEVLQQQFNHHVFVVEQEEYGREGVVWDQIQFKDNQPVIDLISLKPSGLLIQLEEQAMLGRKADNARLLQLFHQTHLNKHPCYSKPRFEGPEFIVRHFAGDVTYNITSMSEKNNDTLQDSLLDVLDISSNPFINVLSRYVSDDADYFAEDAASLSSPTHAGGFPSGRFDGMAALTTLSGSKGGVGSFSVVGGGGGAGASSSSIGDMLAGGASGVGMGMGAGAGAGSMPQHRRGVGGSGAMGSSGMAVRFTGTRVENKQARQEGSGAKNKVHAIAQRVTVSRNFRAQLANLMATLRATEPHYIKCIKPNGIKAPGGFSPFMVRDQLLYSGVLEVVRIRQAGFPVRIPFAELLGRFSTLHKRIHQQTYLRQQQPKRLEQGDDTALANNATTTSSNSGRPPMSNNSRRTDVVVPPPPPADAGSSASAADKENAAALIKTFVPRALYHIGNTKVFLKEDALETLRTAVRHIYQECAVTIQALARAYLGKRSLKKQRMAAVVLQKICRGNIQKKIFVSKRAQVETLQKLWRGKRVRKLYAGDRKLIIKVQAAFRGMVVRHNMARKQKAIVMMQAWGRRYVAMQVVGKELAARRLRATTKAAVCAQAWWRARMASTRFNSERRAAIRIQRKVRSWMRKLHLERDVRNAFDSAAKGNVNAVAAAIKHMPELMFIRSRFDRFKLLLHVAAASGCTSLVSLIDPLPEDVMVPDADGNTPLHFAATSCNFELVKFLATRHCTETHMHGLDSSDSGMGATSPSTAQHVRGLSKRLSTRVINDARKAWKGSSSIGGPGKDDATVRRGSVVTSRPKSATVTWGVKTLTTQASQRFNNSLSSAPTSPSSENGVGSSSRKGAPIFQGYLMKRRETGAWQKRWCVITDTTFEYYHTEQDYSRGKRPARTLLLRCALLKKTEDVMDELDCIPDGNDSDDEDDDMLEGGGGSGSTVNSPANGSRVNSPRGSHAPSVDGSSAVEGAGGGGGGRAAAAPHNKRLSPSPSPVRKGVKGGKQHCFELHSPHLLLCRRNKEGRLYFRAASEEDLYKWLVPLRVMVANQGTPGGVPGERATIRYVNLHKRQAMVNTVNKQGETALHWTAKFGDQSTVYESSGAGSFKYGGGGGGKYGSNPGASSASSSSSGGGGGGAAAMTYQGAGGRGGSSEGRSIARTKIASWFVEAGANVNTKCKTTGRTVLHMAAANRLTALMKALVRKGGDLTITNFAGQTCMDLIKEAEDLQSIAVGYYKAAERLPLLSPPVRAANLTFLSLQVEKLMMQSTASLQNPFMTVTVHDGKGKRIEKPQDIQCPVMVNSSYVWWATTWHMQNPLQNLGPGCFIILELKDQDTDTDKITSLGWGLIQLELSKLDTQDVNMEMFSSPVDFRLQKLCPMDSFLSGDLLLTQS